ncbi:MAG: formimidoylglutamate deiminase [Pseudomonadota bacterium]|nr:formimidoylglutamate deiminase [Pseudomonadota bacterium]
MTDAGSPLRWWAPSAWVAGRWRASVLLSANAEGHWTAVEPDTERPQGVVALAGPALPGMVNAHGHAFQRAFAGLTERRDSGRDDFWSWRDRMYRVASQITPQQLEAVATQLYVELLRGGYTQMCEFHYLQQAAADALVRAATTAGIGLTMLPVLYERAGFRQPALGDDQRRFATTPDDVIRLRDDVRAMKAPRVSAGVAIHSLRAASPEAISGLLARCDGDDGPIHLHIAEQTGEVDDCVAATGARPIEWLARHVALDARWQLVHATHALPHEIAAVAKSGAGVVICPSTEANLGDGLCDLPRWLSAGAAWSIGSDSHVTRDWREELRLLEYGQRLLHRRRNIAAAPELGMPASAERLFNGSLAGGAAAAGQERWGLQAGARADLLVVDTEDESLLGVPDGQLLDALVFSSPNRPWRDVLVAGRWVVCNHHHDAGAASGFQSAMSELRTDTGPCGMVAK